VREEEGGRRVVGRIETATAMPCESVPRTVLMAEGIAAQREAGVEKERVGEEKE
jgi:hypothetical protein